MRGLMADERYHLTDKLIPTGMNRAEFARALLRESARRGDLAKELQLFPTGDAQKQSQPITVERAPFGVKDAVPEKVTAPIGIVVIRDSAVDMLVNNPKGIRVTDETMRALGMSKPIVGFIDNDADAYDFGYSVGSMPEFRKNDGLRIGFRMEPTPAQTAELNKVAASMMAKKTDAEIEAMRGEIQAVITKMSQNYNQDNYCKSTELLFQEGRFHDNRTAMALGMAQGRVDIAKNFDASSDRIGLFGDCPAKKALVR